jgi:hypothetical protein
MVVLKEVDLSDKSLTFFLDEERIPAEALAKPYELKPGDHVFSVKRGNEIVRRVLITVASGRNPGMQVQDITPVAEEKKEPAKLTLKSSPLDALKAEDIPEDVLTNLYGGRKNAPQELVAVYTNVITDNKDLKENYFWSFVLSSNGRSLASARYPWTIIELHNLANGKKFNTIATDPGGWITWTKISPDDQSIYYLRKAGKLFGCNIGGKIRWQHPARGENWSRPALSPDGSTIVTADVDLQTNALHVINAQTGEIRATWRDLLDGPICVLVYSPDGETLIVQSGGTVKFISPKDGKATKTPPLNLGGEPAFSSDGRRLYSSRHWKQPEDYCVEVEVASGKRTECRLPPHGCRMIMPNTRFW